MESVERDPEIGRYRLYEVEIHISEEALVLARSESEAEGLADDISLNTLFPTVYVNPLKPEAPVGGEWATCLPYAPSNLHEALRDKTCEEVQAILERHVPPPEDPNQMKLFEE